MESIFEKYLSDLIQLTPIKIIPMKNKKVISSCIFIPEDPSINVKTPFYFTDLIKSIETFQDRMPKDWIYRLYIDEMFISSIKPKEVRSMLKEESKKNNLSVKQTKKTKSSNSSKSTKSTKSTKSPSSSYEYNYNKFSNESTKSNSGNNETIKIKKRTKRSIKINIDTHYFKLKKLLKLLHLYIKNILESGNARYKNIEIISFKCDKAGLSSKYPGHSSTFGSIIRFFPIFDSDIDMFVSVNSRYPINPLLYEIITNWEKNGKKKLLNFRYDTRGLLFIESNISKFTNKITKLKHRKTLTENDKLFIEVLDGVFELKDNLFKVHGKDRSSFDTMKESKKKLRYKKTKIDDGKIFSYGEESISTYEVIEERSNSIGAGLFGMKRDEEKFSERIIVFAKFLRFLIEAEYDFIFGIDEVLLKITLGFEAGTLNYDKGNIKYGELEETIDYIMCIENFEFELPIVRKLLSTDSSYLTNSIGEPLLLKDNLRISFLDIPNPHFNFVRRILLENMLYSASLYESKSLLINSKKEHLKETDIINYNITYYNEMDLENIIVDISLLFGSFDEYKKLCLYDSSTKDKMTELSEIDNIGDYYTLLDLNKYPLKNINDLMLLLVENFRKPLQPYKLNFIKENYEKSNSLSNSFYF